MKNMSSIGVMLALLATSLLKQQTGSQSKKDFKKFLKAIKNSKKAQEAGLELVSESNHYKFKCKSLIEGEEGQLKTIVFAKTTSDTVRAAKNRRASLRRVTGIDDIDERYFRF